MSEEIIQATINYYARNKQWRHVQEEVKNGLKKLGNEPTMHFWNGFGMLMEGRLAEAMREFNTILSNSNVTLCTSLALIQAHKMNQPVDKDAIADLENKVKNEVKGCGEVALYHAALFLLYTGRHDKARDLVDKIIKANANNADGLALRGWIDLTCGREAFSKKSLKYFDDALKAMNNSLHVDALFGKISYFTTQKMDQNRSLELANQAIVSFQNLLPALIEKARVQVLINDWESALETANRCLNVDAKCIEALRIHLMHKLCRTGNYVDAAKRLGDLIAVLDQSEPNSERLYFEVSLAATRLSGRHRLVLQQTATLLERAMSQSGPNAEYITEMGYQLVLQENEKDALKQFREAMALDQSSVTAVNGVILCQILDGQIAEAAQQLEFLTEIQATLGKSAQLSFLCALLASKKNESADKVLGLLNEAAECHMQAPAVTDQDPMVTLNPDFVMQMAKLYMQYAPSDPPESGESSAAVLKQCIKLLEWLVKPTPGLLEAVYLLARCKYLSGHFDLAQSSAQYCVKQDPTLSEAYLLLAELQLRSKNFRQASTLLEVGLSANFQMRELPMYHVLIARIQRMEGKAEESLRTLVSALKMPGMRTTGQVTQGATPAQTAKRKVMKRPVPLCDRVSLFLEMANAFTEANQQGEALRTIQEALGEFSGTTEELRVVIANADMLVQRGDVDSALGMLKAIKPDNAYFVAARQKMASIMLNTRKDKRLYAQCYRELVDTLPNAHTHMLLGDAYMTVLEPEKAISVYEEALKKNPRDGLLASKIGQALVKIHDYTKAINYYEAAVKAGGEGQMRGDLAELYIKLKKFDQAERVIASGLEHEDTQDLQVLMSDVHFYTLMARLHNASDRPMMAIVTLVRAKETQARIIQRVAVEQPELLKQQQQIAAELCIAMAQHHEATPGEAQKALACYQDALKVDESSVKAMLALATMHLASGDLEDAQYHLTCLLRADKYNNDATVMLADLMFRKQEYDAATFHFQQLLERSPDHYEALARLVELLRRAGKLAMCPKFLDQAEKSSPRAVMEPGFNYCRGLYKMFSHSNDEALKAFNLARKDGQYGLRASFNMVDIYLNPDNETIGSEIFAGRPLDMANIQNAETLLDDLQTIPEAKNSKRYIAQRALCKLLQRSKGGLEKTLEEYIALSRGLETDPTASLGMARCHILMKQKEKARTLLKVICNSEWSAVNTDDYEQCLLLYADQQIEQNKLDLAQAALKKVLLHNKSCSRGWEYMGYIMEKELNFVHAAEFYENAWTHCNKSDPAVGYKLAFNYLKAKRNVDAIDVCHVVLQKNPEYPKIRKEIMEKARLAIRV